MQDRTPRLSVHSYVNTAGSRRRWFEPFRDLKPAGNGMAGKALMKFRITARGLEHTTANARLRLKARHHMRMSLEVRSSEAGSAANQRKNRGKCHFFT